ncbi:MAG: carboxymuconolactone decarboxylase family protein [Alcanivoracaceae bacterium]|nr:carboxymuconolactone decarboxylase family protein [Alcanivoracaceae bacterium]
MNNFTFYTTDNATGDAKDILDKVQNKYGFVPNLFGYMAEAPYTIDAYAYMTNLLGKTDLTPAQQQIALLAVSHYHDCKFCALAHRAFGKASNSNAQTMLAIVSGKKIEDEKDRAIVDMINATLENRGWVDDEHLNAFYAAGFTKRNVYDLILIISIKTLSNYSNHLTKPEPNSEIISML